MAENGISEEKKKEIQSIMDSLYPVGKERWIKVKYLDQEKAMENIRMRSMSVNDIREEDRALGFVVTAMGIMDEYNPQVSALMDIRGELVGGLMHIMEPSQIEMIDGLFIQKIKELKDNTIEYAPYTSKPVQDNELVIDRLEDGTWRVLLGDSVLEKFGNQDHDEIDALKFVYSRGTHIIK